MNENLDKYKQWLIINGKAPNTVDTYIKKINKLLVKVKLKDINEETIIQFLSTLTEKFTPTTQNSYRNAIRSFLKFLNKNVVVPQNLKVKKKLPIGITETYFEKELLPLVDCIFQNPLKLKAILYFMFYTGVRVSEVPSLKREDVNLTERTAKIYAGKGNEERIVFFNNKTKEMLDTYFSVEPEDTNAFNTSKQSIQKKLHKIKPYCKNINIHSHLFRHSFATMFLANGGDLSTLSKLLGHKNIQTTMMYSGLQTHQLKVIYDNIINKRRKK